MLSLIGLSIGMVGVKMESKYLRELTFTNLRLEIIQKHERW
jgi:hypothetical protein